MDVHLQKTFTLMILGARYGLGALRSACFGAAVFRVGKIVVQRIDLRLGLSSRSDGGGCLRRVEDRGVEERSSSYVWRTRSEYILLITESACWFRSEA